MIYIAIIAIAICFFIYRPHAAIDTIITLFVVSSAVIGFSIYSDWQNTHRVVLYSVGEILLVAVCLAGYKFAAFASTNRLIKAVRENQSRRDQ